MQALTQDDSAERDCATRMKTAQTESEEDLGSCRSQSETAATENLHADKRRFLRGPAGVFLELMRLRGYIVFNFMSHFTSGTS